MNASTWSATDSRSGVRGVAGRRQRFRKGYAAGRRSPHGKYIVIRGHRIEKGPQQAVTVANRLYAKSCERVSMEEFEGVMPFKVRRLSGGLSARRDIQSVTLRKRPSY